MKLKVITKQDKAAVLNKLKASKIPISTDNIKTPFPVDEKTSHFYITGIDENTANLIQKLFNNNSSIKIIKIPKLEEIIRKIVRKNLES